MIWGWALSSFLIMFIGLAMVSRPLFQNWTEVLIHRQAELASAMPTSGGVSHPSREFRQITNIQLYFWTHKLSPPEYRNFLAWLVGCTSNVSTS
jgi:hypothetical protein